MKTMDMIVLQPFAPYVAHSDMVAMGYKFLCAHVSIEAFIDGDMEVQTDRHEVYAVESCEGYNFYVR